MSNLYKTGLIAALFALLTACGGADSSDNHGHPHDGDAEHAHEAAADDHGHDHDGDDHENYHENDHEHDNGHDHNGDHGHPHDDAAAATEAFYGDEADAPAEPADAADDAAGDEEHDHHHDGEEHEHQH
jgi:hypothetical protein